MIHTSLRPELSLLSRDLADAGWPTARYRLRVEGPGLDEPLEAELEQPFLLVGRDRGAGLWLPDTRVRRRHAYLHLTAEGAYLVPLSRRRRDGIAGLSSSWLTEPATIEFGPYQVTLSRIACPISARPSFGQAHEGDALEPTRRHDLMNPLARDAVSLQLQIHAPGGACAVRRLKRPLTLLGRRKPSHLQLVHPSVSQPHCLLVHGGERLWVVDLQSRLGTRVNEHPVQIARIEGGDRLQLGDVVLQARGVAEAGRNGSSARRTTPAAAKHCNQGATAGALPARAAKQQQDDVLPVEPDDETNHRAAPVQTVGPRGENASFESDAARTCLNRPQNGHHQSPNALRPLSEPAEDVGSQLQRLERALGAATDRTQQQTEQTAQLAERLEQIRSLGVETHELTRKLAERVDALQRGFAEQQPVWQECSERLSDLEQSVATTAHTQANQTEQQLRDSQAELREAYEALRAECQRCEQEWSQHRALLEEQCSGLEERLRACEQSGDGVEQAGARWRREWETMRREQDGAAETVALLRDEFQALAQQWQAQQAAVVDEQTRTRERLDDVCQQWEVLQANFAQMQERWERERQSMADQVTQRDERQAQMEKAFDAHAEKIKRLRRDVAALDRVHQGNDGNGRDVEAPLAGESGTAPNEFDKTLEPATAGLLSEAEEPAEHGAPQDGASGDWQKPNGQGPTCVGEFRNGDVLEHGDDDTDESPVVAPRHAIDLEEERYALPGEVTQADKTATQWLFHRAATLSERRRRTWQRKLVVGLAAALLLAALIGGFALWHSGLVQEAQHAMFG